MAKKEAEAFVRAKPSQISITETYRYKAEVSDYASMSFVEADGEIKVEFLYDGGRRDFRWKLRVAWKGLMEKWGVLRWFRKQLRTFFNLKLLRWITKRLGLGWLWKNIEKLLLGRQEDKRYFGIASISDSKKYSDEHQSVQVGHLALRGYRKPNFIKNWAEDETLKLRIPIDDLEQKLAQSQKYELCFGYPVQEPEAPPVRLQDATLTDVALDRSNQKIWPSQNNGHFDEQHSAYDEILRLKIDLELEGGQPNVNADGQVPKNIIESWWHKSKQFAYQNEEDEKQEDSEEKDNKEDFPLQDQIRCLRGFCEVGELVWVLNLLIWRGGYLLVRLDKSVQIEKLEERLLRAAFLCRPFAPILKPYSYKLNDGGWVVVVPVPMIQDNRSSHQESHLVIESNLQPSIDKIDAIIDKNNEKDLAEILSALVNTAGGLILVTAGLDDDTEDTLILRKALLNVFQLCQPRLDLEDAPIYLVDTWSNGWVISIDRASSKVYSVDGNVYKWVDNRPKALATDEIYEFIKSRCISDCPLIMVHPVISHAYINWPYFDPREGYRIRHDPQKQIIKWSDAIQSEQTHHHRFKMGLPLEINRPLELYNQRQIRGEIHIDFEEYLQSGLDIDYFNALGERRPYPQGGTPFIEKKSKVILGFEIMLDSVLRRRWFTTERKLEFEGVRPDSKRLDDISGMLASLGLENIMRRPAKKLPDNLVIPFTEDFVRMVMNNGGYMIEGHKLGLLKVTLHIEGQSIEILRERAEGERIDEMEVEAGNMHVTIKGQIKGESPQELLILLNRLQQMLTERFDYVRFQVA